MEAKCCQGVTWMPQDFGYRGTLLSATYASPETLTVTPTATATVFIDRVESYNGAIQKISMRRSEEVWEVTRL